MEQRWNTCENGVKRSNNRITKINIESGHTTPRSQPIIDTAKLRKKTP